MKFPDKEMIKRLRKMYPAGCRVKLLKMDNVQAPSVDTMGTVQGVDDIGSIRVSWDNGSHLSIAYGIDICCKMVNEVEKSRKDRVKFR